MLNCFYGLARGNPPPGTPFLPALSLLGLLGAHDWTRGSQSGRLTPVLDVNRTQRGYMKGLGGPCHLGPRTGQEALAQSLLSTLGSKLHTRTSGAPDCPSQRDCVFLLRSYHSPALLCSLCFSLSFIPHLTLSLPENLVISSLFLKQ